MQMQTVQLMGLSVADIFEKKLKTVVWNWKVIENILIKKSAIFKNFKSFQVKSFEFVNIQFHRVFSIETWQKY